MYLNCHTWLSYKYGTLSPDALFSEAKRCGVRKLALTEINNVASYMELLRVMHERRDEFELEIAVGMEFREEHELRFIAIARNNTGFEKINRYRSYLNSKAKAVPERAPVIEETFIVYPWGKIEPELLRSNEFLGVRPGQLPRLMLYKPYKEFRHKFVVWHPVTFANKEGFNIHRLLRAIALNTLLSKLSSHYQADPSEGMLSEAELERIYQNFPDILQNTRQLLDACTFEMEMHTDKNKKYLTDNASTDWDTLVTRAWEGFQHRYAVGDPALRARLDHELRTIQDMNFCGYFLIVYDIIQFAISKSYDFVGRGSGANSMVAYCLGITNVDPVELDLYFERFLNPERTSPPDFDVDFSWDNRDAIYEYIFKKYGYDHVCLLGTQVTFSGRSTIRELCKVFGLPSDETDELVTYTDAVKDRDHISQLIVRYSEKMEGFPNYPSIHAAGVLITEAPIYCYTATELPPKNLPVSQFEMHAAEDFGIFKFDILSQRGLGHIKETVKLVKRNRNEDVNVYRFRDFKQDEKIKYLLRNGLAMGCFYVESPAMRSLLQKLGCEDYLTLVAASSIIRPGVSSSGMMRAYIERFHAVRNGQTYESIHPKMDELMKETYGVMVYQEDVIRVAHHFAGLSLGESDVLRRAMSGKYRGRKAFAIIREKYFANCKAFGYEQHVTDRVWLEMESFGGYSFAKGHSASFAVESYQSLFLKAHYPLEFMVGVINNFGGFYSTEFYFHEARMSGGIIEAPCVNRSQYLTSISGSTIYIGFIHLKSLESKIAKSIVTEREAHGEFQSVTNFLNRIDIGLEQARILIRIGGFRFTGQTKQQLLWEAIMYFSAAKARKYRHTQELFEGPAAKSRRLPLLQYNDIESAFDEIELLGFPLCDPFTLLASPERGDTTARQLMEKVGQQVTLVGYLVTTKDTRTKKGDLMHFGTFLDQHGHVFDTVNFPPVARRFPFRGRGFYLMKGKVTEDFGVPAIEVTVMDKMGLINKRELPPTQQASREEPLTVA